jgi:hypothetical protein
MFIPFIAPGTRLGAKGMNMSQTSPRRGPAEPTREIAVFEADARPVRPLPEDHDVLRAMFREADRYIAAACPLLHSLRSLGQFGPRSTSDWDALRRRHELEALSKRLADLGGLDLLLDHVRASSLQALAEEHETVHRQACVEAGTNDTKTDCYKFYFMLNLLHNTTTMVQQIRDNIFAKLEGDPAPYTGKKRSPAAGIRVDLKKTSLS